MSGYRLDELDRRIIEKLSRDARVSNRRIAAELDITEGTIRSRIKRLQTERLIQFAVITDFRVAGSPNLVMLGIQADPGRVGALAKQLADIPEINCVIVLLGRYSLMAMGLFSSIEQLNSLIFSRIRVLEGVRDVETSISVHNVKYEVGVARIAASRTITDESD
ncbi:Lrp/AsnC family transcriptional regulator [Sphingomonas bacterium]|uniref:Lrp/AsnC family transcriptional regulator n=1 Tax=Sphingomonas bacterium TaxID=1895847 RepID=UPI001575E389|nr:Lrp/AsnC family transcriptional regulator [Sphingomonas bacterium]